MEQEFVQGVHGLHKVDTRIFLYSFGRKRNGFHTDKSLCTSLSPFNFNLDMANFYLAPIALLYAISISLPL